MSLSVLCSEFLSDEHAAMLRIPKQTSSSKVVTTRRDRGDYKNLGKLQKHGNQNHADFDQSNNEMKQKKFPSERTGEVGLSVSSLFSGLGGVLSVRLFRLFRVFRGRANR